MLFDFVLDLKTSFANLACSEISFYFAVGYWRMPSVKVLLSRSLLKSLAVSLVLVLKLALVSAITESSARSLSTFSEELSISPHWLTSPNSAAKSCA